MIGKEEQWHEQKQRVSAEFLSLLHNPPLAAGHLYPAFKGRFEKGKDDSNSVKNQRDLLNDFTDATLTSLKASRNMWMMVILERTPTVKIFNGSWRMS